MPVPPTQRLEDPGDNGTDRRQNGAVDLLLAEHPEGTLHKAEVGGKPHKDGRQQNDGSRFFDEAPTPLPH